MFVELFWVYFYKVLALSGVNLSLWLLLSILGIVEIRVLLIDIIHLSRYSCYAITTETLSVYLPTRDESLSIREWLTCIRIDCINNQRLYAVCPINLPVLQARLSVRSSTATVDGRPRGGTTQPVETA